MTKYLWCGLNKRPADFGEPESVIAPTVIAPTVVLKAKNGGEREVNTAESPISVNRSFCGGWVDNASFLSNDAQFILEWKENNWYVKSMICEQPNFVNGIQLTSEQVLHKNDYISIGASTGGYVEFTVAFR